MNPAFPILNISLKSMTLQDMEDIHIGDLWDYTNNNTIFNELYLNQEYVDQHGGVFKLIGKIKSNFVHNLLHFNKYELKLEYTGRSISFMELKDFVIRRYNTLENDFEKSILIKLAEKSNTFSELIG